LEHTGYVPITARIFPLSWRAKSIEALAKITPVNPPKVNNKIKPKENKKGV